MQSKRMFLALCLMAAGSSLVGAQARRPLSELTAEVARRVAQTAGPRPTGSPAPETAWAYYLPDMNAPLRDVPDVLAVPGSAKTFARVDLFDPFHSFDWFPDEHPPMPAIVSSGREGVSPACVMCHTTAGTGHPSSANLAGLPVAYLQRQLADFKSGARKNWPMARLAAQMSDDDVRQASQWFASLKPGSSIHVVEATTAPEFFTVPPMRLPVPGGQPQPLGERILEFPQDEMRARLEDPHATFVAYVPPGSVAKGAALAQTGGGGKTLMCTICHGQDLRGVGDIPAIAGRAPTYTVRQMIAFKTGTRATVMGELMKPVVANLTPADMLAIAAYVGSRQP